jgi:hypothetical protein
MKRILFILFALILLGGELHSQVTMLSSNPIKKSQIMAFTSFQFFEGYDKYDWNSNSWIVIPEADRTSTASLLTMVGYGVTSKLSIYLQYPVYEQIKNNNCTFNQGEITVMSRYAIIPSSAQKSGLTLIGAVRLPSAPTTNNPFADGSVDFTVGEIFSTKWYGNWRTHIKSAFYMNTKNEIEENPGDELQIFLKQDYKLGRVKLYLNNIFNYQSKKRNRANEIVENTQTHRIFHLLGAEFSVQNKFLIKPKIQIPSYAKGGSKFKEKFILDLIYYL